MDMIYSPFKTAICLSLVVLIAASLSFSIAEQVAHAQQIETRKIGVMVVNNHAGIISGVNKTLDLVLDDFNKLLTAENKNWRLAADKIIIYNPRDTDAAFKEFNKNGIQAVAGLIADAALTNANDTIHENDMLVVASTGGTQEHSKQDKIFRTGSNYNHVADSVVKLLAYHDNKEIIHLVPDTPGAKSINATIYEYVAARDDITILGSIGFDSTEITDPDRILNEMQILLGQANNHSEVGIYVMGTARNAEVIGIVAALDVGENSPISQTTFYGLAYLRPGIEANPEIFAFLNKTNFYGIAPAAHENEYNIRLDSLLGRTVSGAIYDTYTAVYILGLAIDMAGTAVDTDAIASKMHQAAVEYTPISARGLDVKLDVNGDVAERDIHIFSVVHDTFEYTLKYDPDRGISEPIPYTEPERRPIGAIVSETGTSGLAASYAISQAVADFNIAQHNADADWRLDLTKVDDNADPAMTLRNIGILDNRFAAQVVIGPAFNEGLAAIKDHNMVLISYGAESSEFSVADDNIFRTLPDDTGIIRAYIEILKQDDIKNVIIVRDDLHGQNMMVNAIGNEFNILGIINHQANYAETTNRIANALNMADRTGTAVLLYISGDITHMMNAARSNPQLQDGRWYGNQNPPTLLDNADRAAWLEQVGYTAVTTRYIPNTVNEHINSNIPNADIHSYHAYDAVMLVVDVMSNVNTAVHSNLTPAQVSQGAAENTIGPPALGVPLVFNNNGDLRTDSVDHTIHRVSGGEFVPSRIYDSSGGPYDATAACNISYSLDYMEFDTIAASRPSLTISQDITNTGTDRIGRILLSASDWTDDATGITHKITTEVHVPGVLEWTQLDDDLEIYHTLDAGSSFTMHLRLDPSSAESLPGEIGLTQQLAYTIYPADGDCGS